MKTYLDCFPCFLNQALRAARITTDDEKKIKRVLDKVGIMPIRLLNNWKVGRGFGEDCPVIALFGS